ncbi:MAG: YfiR family protein [Vulcanimicrobiota bacterium]
MDVLKPRNLLLALVSALLLAQPALASREYQLKAAFIYNFIKFVEWPSTPDTIKVGILGTDPFAGELNKLESKKVGNRSIQVTQLKSLADARHCQVVFTSDAAQAKKLVAELAGEPVLTVSDAAGFSEQGGCITLMSSRNRIRFAINTKTLKDSRLKASSKLLGLAEKLYSMESLEVVARAI